MNCICARRTVTKQSLIIKRKSAPNIPVSILRYPHLFIRMLILQYLPIPIHVLLTIKFRNIYGVSLLIYEIMPFITIFLALKSFSVKLEGKSQERVMLVNGWEEFQMPPACTRRQTTLPTKKKALIPRPLMVIAYLTVQNANSPQISNKYPYPHPSRAHNPPQAQSHNNTLLIGYYLHMHKKCIQNHQSYQIKGSIHQPNIFK